MTPTGTPAVTPTVIPTGTPAVPPVTPVPPVVPGTNVPSFRVDVISGHHGRAIEVLAQMRGRHDHDAHQRSNRAAFTASAVANLTSGPVTVQLRRTDIACVAMGIIQVPASETASTVTVDVTVVYSGVTQPVIHTSVRIKEFTKIHE